MKVYDMFGDFRCFYEESKVSDRWEAWKKYYVKYDDIFDGMLKYLYMMDFESFRPMVECTDFDWVFKNAEAAVNDNKASDIIEIVEKCMKLMDFNDDFDLYLGVALGHVNGTAFMMSRPLVYFGLETLSLHDLNILVPHEFNHMIRFYYTNTNNGKDRLKDRIITEGLGTFSSLHFCDSGSSDEKVTKAMMISQKCMNRIKAVENKVKEDIFSQLDMDMNQGLMTKYFTYNYNEEIEGMPVKTGYYIGMQIIQKLADRGYSLSELTKMNTDEVFEEYCRRNE